MIARLICRLFGHIYDEDELKPTVICVRCYQTVKAR